MQNPNETKSAEIRWVSRRWPGLTYKQIARLVCTDHANVRSAFMYGVREALRRPPCLPIGVQEGTPFDAVAALADALRPTGADIHVPWTSALEAAATRAGMHPHEFVALAVREACEKCEGA